MKILLTKFFTSLLFLFFIMLCAFRYLEWNIDSYLVYAFVIISGIASIIIAQNLISNDTNNIINPYLVYSIFIFLLGFSFIPLSEKNNKFDSWSFLILLLSVFFFIIGIFIGKNLKIKFIAPNINNKIKQIALNLIMCMSIIVFILECYKIGFIPIFNVLKMDVYNIMNENAIPILHYFILLVYIIPIWLQILYKRGIISKKKLWLYTLVSCFILINYLSRQMWILLIICTVLYYSYYNRITRRQLLLFVVGTISLFIIMGSIRLFTAVKDDRNNTEYLKNFSNINYDVNIFEVYLGLYSSINFSTFNSFVNKSDKEDYKAYGLYTFNPIITLSGISMISEDFKIDDNYNSFYSLATYAIEPYLDFGLIGVILINLLYGIFVAYTYRQYSLKRERWIIPWSLMIFCMVMATFTNFFNTFFIWFAFSINFLLLPSCNNKYDIRKK